jgi:hypothetical protein
MKKVAILHSVLVLIIIAVFAGGLYYLSDPRRFTREPDDGRWGNDLRSHKYEHRNAIGTNGGVALISIHSRKCWCIGTEWEIDE